MGRMTKREHGWELMQWQALIRKKAKEFDEVIVACNPRSRYLYSDFTTEFIDFIPYPLNGNYDCELNYGRVFNNFFDKYREDPNTEVFDVFRLPRPQSKDDPSLKCQEFIKFGKKQDDPKYQYDIIIHARDTSKCGTSIRNWSLNKWKQVVNHFKDYKIAMIGLSDSSNYIRGTTDLLDIGLEQLADTFASSKLIIGTSSGPIHLASLCGLRHLVIVPSVEVKRYTNWNIFDTPFEILGKYGWCPSSDYIIKAIKRNLDEI